MSSLTDTLLTTALKRPYVFLFLLAFLFISIRKRGIQTSLLFLLIGYTIAWVSEALSIRIGFPYGWYFYVYENMKGEWMNWGVPVWDSLSYTFMCFASIQVVDFFLGENKRGRFSWKAILLSALAVVVLDLIADPIANQGDKWFLGHIYYYPSPGWYFGIPASNFIGWFFVATLINGVDYLLLRQIRANQRHRRAEGEALAALPMEGATRAPIIDRYAGLGLYAGILFFNLLITLYIGPPLLVACDLGWILVLFFGLSKIKSENP